MNANTVKRLSASLAGLILIAILISGCGSPAAATPVTPPTEVSVRLKWNHQTQFAGLYMADKEGYYAAENLKVTIEPVDFDQMLSSDKVAQGKNTFGIGSADEVLVARSKGIPLKAIAVIFRISPLVYMSVGDTKISQPGDLIGKTVALSDGQGTWLFDALINKAGVDGSQIKIKKSTTFDALECLKTADVCDAYSIDGMVNAQSQGLKASAIWPGDYGVPFYADVVFTTDDFIAKNPEVVTRFLRATLRGWQAAIENPEKATDVSLIYAPKLDRNFQLGAMKAIIPLVDTGNLPVGVMEPGMWKQMYDILVAQKVITTPFDVTTAYTSQFMDQLKGK